MSEKFQLVGSLLRPEALLKYKSEIEKRDDIIYPFYDAFEGYEACELEAIQTVVQEQIDHNIEIITDGEYSKSLWHLDFVWGLSGIERYIAEHGYFFRDKDEVENYETRKDVGLRIVDKLGGTNHHFIAIFEKLKAAAKGHSVKLCIPSPSHIFGELSWSDNIGGQDAVYNTTAELKAGLLGAYKEFFTDYAQAGGKIIQLDDCLWEMFADDNPNSPFTGEANNEAAATELATEFIELNNALIDFGHELGLKVWTHNCRGNYDSRNMGGGSYIKIASLFLKQLKYDRFFLEWDDERAGSLDALKVFQDRPNVEIVLGLLSSKTNTLDDEKRVIRLLDEASKIIDKERLLLSHQCGFASCDGGNELTEAEQWAKIDQGQRIAQAYWGK
ncbi:MULTISPECIES: cobalamin-independent methionine synthase II family protein [unclassified Enterococcus]|uniref:cobalamin-independent methionine synthase II family protein n=1 Tax=unclassified Enterococcus TaxID=2608891 RepID=UPI001555FB8E|nr:MULTISPECIES: cobalamin-independent methionine synthase II family protein [unclassified Enterococcus]MBS7577149.1 cobalamin-independent methionine synthase II family protein [Enterococcus sp. MMGLQ5-2]MBS7584404.1 cobalamin-independent methionine synthase II family protein [Enterococcus sp. MMGLQ5-1]NPD12259.1 cobalamin-independent methionine synthase II family protein [Enterococcus sp. MMGLQ5-1]NPD36983.1 cobalamin-independent methionine synthase II family protein [Enterococcus sp. MMGLQ5-2